MVSSYETEQKRRQRERYLQEPHDFEGIYHEALTRVQFMKTRHAKIFDVTDEAYTYYARAKKLISKFEYHQRQMNTMATDMELAELNGDPKAYKECDAKYEKYMKNCLYFSFGISQLYRQFIRSTPNEGL